MRAPSGENPTEETELVCPLNGSDSALPVFASQILIVWSKEPETMRAPSGENPTEKTEPVCPLNGSDSALPVFASQVLIVLS